MKFCVKPFNNVYLASDGEVWPCGWMHYVIGNLYEQNLDEIWHSEAAEQARKSILDGSFAFCRKTSCPFCERDELPDLTEEEIRERFETLSYLKIHPRDREENKFLLLKGERIYEESLGEKRHYIEAALHKYEKALNTYDTRLIEEAKEEFKKFLEELEEL